MKPIRLIIVVLAVFVFHNAAFANFVGAKVKVTGVTCSMCSNAVNKALSSLGFIDKVEVDLDNAVFKLTFKEGQKVVVDEIKNKIEGAGFSVGELVADFKFNEVSVTKDYHYQFEGNTYHFVGVQDKKLADVVSLKFVDKGLTSAKEYKKYAAMTTMACFKSGKSEECCKSGVAQRIYHVTL